jgi:uncharacterized protein YutE (UPF0331/DUF86 family)
MSRLNEELVKTRAQEIRENLNKVRHYTSLPDDDFWADERNLYTIMHLLLMSIEATAALCSHILARLARRAPASYAECFEGLRGLDVLDDELADSLVQMARFRNLLVHRYWQIEPDRVLSYARENLGDFESFLAAVGQLMAQAT